MADGGANSLADPLRFAEKLIAVLDSGRFTATYKFATLIALIDVCVESVGPSGLPPSSLSARQIGRRVLELFWVHATPYTSDTAQRRYLRHSTLQSDLVSKVTEFREQHGLGAGISIDVARRRLPSELTRLEDQVVETVIRMPLPKLQRFGTGSGVREDRFLYDYNWPDEVSVSAVRSPDFDDTLHLHPGVGEWLVRLSGVLRPIIEQRWAAFVADRSRDIVEAAWLDDFLFGTKRVGLNRAKAPLLRAQDGSCFYCGMSASVPQTEVDHFIPWSRHPDNGLHNLVSAHRSCNNSKRDSLASTDHLRHWVERLHPNGQRIARLHDLAAELKWPMDVARGTGTVRANYLWLPHGALLWSSPGVYEPADPEVIQSLLASGPFAGAG